MKAVKKARARHFPRLVPLYLLTSRLYDYLYLYPTWSLSLHGCYTDIHIYPIPFYERGIEINKTKYSVLYLSDGSRLLHLFLEKSALPA